MDISKSGTPINPKLRAFSEAIGVMEGYNVTEAQAKARGIHFPTLPQLLNNPGDLIFVGQHQAVPYAVKGADGRTRVYCKFPDIETGFADCDFQVSLFAGRNLTVQQTINKWAPTDDGNNPNSYTAGLCKILNCKSTDLVAKVISMTSESLSVAQMTFHDAVTPGRNAFPTSPIKTEA